MPSVASSGMQFDGTSATLRHFVTLCLSVCRFLSIPELTEPVLSVLGSGLVLGSSKMVEEPNRAVIWHHY